MMPAFPPLTSAKRALFPALIASLALALPQSGSQGNGTDTPYTLSPNTSTASTASTHLPPSLIHSSLPTFNFKAQVKNDQREDIISTATIFSTIIVPTTTELTTILTVITNTTNAPHSPTPASSHPTTTSSSSPSTPTSNCIVEGETDGICVTVVPIWPTNSLTQAQARALKRQIQTQTHSTPSYSYSSTSTSTASVTVIEMLTVIVAPHTTYTLTGFVPFSTSISPAPSPSSTTATSGITTSTSVACPSPSWLIDGHCVGNTPGWNPAPQNPTETDDWAWDERPRPPWETATTAV